MDPATPRLFTLDEANALLPQVRDLLAAIQTRAVQLGDLQERLGGFRERKRHGEHEVEGEARLVQDVLAEANRIGVEIRSSIQNLLALGCEIKDVQQGLVDFPAQRE